MTKTIYYDMDNCLALFSTKGNEANAISRMFDKGYFKNLPVIENAMETLSALMWEGHDVHILSACVNSPYCKIEKKEWLEKYFPFIESHKIHLCEVGENKAEIIGNVKGAYLVDDYKKNLIEWEEAGGISVKKRSSKKTKWNNVVYDHMEIFDIIERK